MHVHHHDAEGETHVMCDAAGVDEAAASAVAALVLRLQSAEPVVPAALWFPVRTLALPPLVQ